MAGSDNPYANNPPPPTDGTYGSYSAYGGAGTTTQPETAYTGDGKATTGGEAASYYGTSANPSNNYTTSNSYTSPSSAPLESHSYEYEQAAAAGNGPAAPPPAYGSNPSGQGFAPPAGPPPGQSYAPPSGPPPKS